MPNPRTPTAIKRLAGNPGKRKIAKAEPVPYGVAVAPQTLSEAAKPIWQRIATSMPLGVYTATDEHLLAAYCEQVVQQQLATAMLAVEPALIAGSTGQLVVSPWMKIQQESARLIVTLGAQLGLSPTTRANLNAPAPVENNPFLN